MNKEQTLSYGQDIDMSIGRSLFEISEDANKEELFLMYIDFVIKDLLADYLKALDSLAGQFEDIRTNVKIKKSYRKEFREDINNTKKDIIKNKNKILKEVDNIVNKFLIGLNSGRKHNEVLLDIVNAIADIIIDNKKAFFIRGAGSCLQMDNKVVEKVEAIRTYHIFLCSKNSIEAINIIKGNVNSILTPKNTQDIIIDNQSQILDHNLSQQEELKKNIKDIERIIDSVRIGIALLIQNYPYKFSVVYKRLQIAIDQLSEIEELRNTNISQETIIQKQGQLIESLKKIEQDYSTLKIQNIADNKVNKEQKLLITHLESQIKAFQEALKKSNKSGRHQQANDSEGLQNSNQDKIKELEGNLLRSWQEMEELNIKFDKEKTELNDLVAKQLSINTSLNLALEATKLSKNKEIEIFINNCEIDFKDCSNDELLKYVVHSNCSDEIKKEATGIIIDFLNNFVSQVVKGASSSMNDNVGVGGGRYSNKFINPMINFIKQKQMTMPYNRFLEEISYINWKKLIEQYSNEGDYTNRKQKIVKSVLAMFLCDCKSAFPIFKALKYLANKLKVFDVGDKDLSILALNMTDALDSNYVQNAINSRLIAVAEKIKNEKNQDL